MEGYMNEDVANYGRDVTIYLIPNSMSAERQDSASDPSRKRKRIAQDVDTYEGLAPLCEIHANSTTLRQCSKYFESLMSGRWSMQTQTGQSSSVPMKFYLEAQTEGQYYQDCFSRMIFLHQPIGSVIQCIELLKVASQIEFKKLMDICLQCLSAIPWSHGEEEQIRELCVSGQYLSSDSAADLSSRLRISLTKRDVLNELGACLRRALSRYFDFTTVIATSDSFTIDESREVLELAFQAIFSEMAPKSMGHCVLVHNVLTMVKKAAPKLLKFIERSCHEMTTPPSGVQYSIADVRGRISDVGADVLDFLWFFRTLKKYDATQAVVEVLVKDQTVARSALEAGYFIYRSYKELWPEWLQVQTTVTDMVTEILEDIMAGRSFLKTSDRITLFMDWKWVVLDAYTNIADKSASSSTQSQNTSKALASFIMTFPLPQQEEIYRLWMSKDGNELDCGSREMSQAHRMWTMDMITQLSNSK